MARMLLPVRAVDAVRAGGLPLLAAADIHAQSATLETAREFPGRSAPARLVTMCWVPAIERPPALGSTPGSENDMARVCVPLSDELPKAFGGSLMPAASCLLHPAGPGACAGAGAGADAGAPGPIRRSVAGWLAMSHES
jgi:hypothetical protein